jgi:hypothetical protein
LKEFVYVTIRHDRLVREAEAAHSSQSTGQTAKAFMLRIKKLKKKISATLFLTDASSYLPRF